MKKQNYRVTRCYEQTFYRSSSNYLKNFFLVGSHFVHKYKKHNTSDAEYCDAINKQMKYAGTGLELDPNDLKQSEDDTFFQKVIKQSLNAMSGKIYQKNAPYWKFAQSYEDLMCRAAKEEVVGLEFIGNKLAMELVPTFNRLNGRTNCIIGSTWTSYGRQRLFELLLGLKEKVPSFVPLYTDCDSLGKEMENEVGS